MSVFSKNHVAYVKFIQIIDYIIIDMSQNISKGSP